MGVVGINHKEMEGRFQRQKDTSQYSTSLGNSTWPSYGFWEKNLFGSNQEQTGKVCFLRGQLGRQN